MIFGAAFTRQQKWNNFHGILEREKIKHKLHHLHTQLSIIKMLNKYGIYIIFTFTSTDEV